MYCRCSVWVVRISAPKRKKTLFMHLAFIIASKYKRVDDTSLLSCMFFVFNLDFDFKTGFLCFDFYFLNHSGIMCVLILSFFFWRPNRTTLIWKPLLFAPLFLLLSFPISFYLNLLLHLLLGICRGFCCKEKKIVGHWTYSLDIYIFSQIIFEVILFCPIIILVTIFQFVAK